MYLCKEEGPPPKVLNKTTGCKSGQVTSSTLQGGESGPYLKETVENVHAIKRASSESCCFTGHFMVRV